VRGDTSNEEMGAPHEPDLVAWELFLFLVGAMVSSPPP